MTERFDRNTFGFTTVDGEIPQMPSLNDKLGFGKVFAPYIFIAEFNPLTGEWENARVEPYEMPRRMPLGELAGHYARTIFEGTKVFVGKDGLVRTFCLQANADRMSRGAQYMDMAPVPGPLFVAGIHAGVRANAHAGWLPGKEGFTLYTRPVLEAIDEELGVKSGTRFRFYVLFSPSGPYYPTGMAPNHVWMETQTARVAPSKIIGIDGKDVGFGAVKYSGHYGNTGILTRAQRRLKELGSDATLAQALYLASVDWHKPPLLRAITEFGTANVLIVTKNGDIISPPESSGAILPSITKQALFALHRASGGRVIENEIPLTNLVRSIRTGGVTEIIGAGTAAVASPTGWLHIELSNTSSSGTGVGGYEMLQVGKGEVGPVTRRLHGRLTAIQYGHELSPREFWGGPDVWIEFVDLD